MGVYAANHLLARLDDRSVELRNKLPTELIVRASAAAPKANV
jgi:DNA-binding LacI/PurR family transcriptional regulator